MKFNPKYGDIIVTNNDYMFVCKPDVKGYGRGSIYGEININNWQDWDESGNVCGSYDNPRWNIREIIPAKGSEPCEIAESDLEFKLKVLQKENEFLNRLLLKEGKL